MPTYDYECQKCGKRFEAVQKMTDERLTDCPQEDCDGKVKRLIGTGAGLLFKGSGFYITDYRSDSYKAGAKSDSGSAAATSGDAKKSESGGSGGGKETKPATPAAPTPKKDS